MSRHKLMMHKAQAGLRKIKHTREKKPSTCASSKEDSLEFDRIISEELLSRRKMDESRFSRLVEDNPLVNCKMGKKKKEMDVQRFYREKFHVLKTYRALRPFWRFRKDIFGHVRGFDHWIYLMLQDERAIVWLRFLVAGYAAAKIQACEKAPRIVDFPITPIQLEPLLRIAKDIVNNYTPNKFAKATLMQLLLPAMQKKNVS